MISSTSNVSSPSTTSASTGAGLQLGPDAFLQMLTTELENQDPLNPTDESSMISELAQFSSLQEMTNVNTGVTQLNSIQQLQQATGLIGHQVTAVDSQGNSTSGVVSSVVNQNGVAMLDINNVLINPNTVQTVQ